MSRGSPEHEHDSRFSVPARLRSFRFALGGLAWLVKLEPNARIHLAASIAVVAAGLSLGVTSADWRWLVLAIALVWITEAINTSLERISDVVSPEFDPRIGLAKDVAAGAVLIAALAAAAIGLLTLLPYFWVFIEGSGMSK
ncbi:MAG: hypothetical protein RLZ98_1343 [Pseudomonadota bacterium]|jgi:diacylglycerol kinase (ATP)